MPQATKLLKGGVVILLGQVANNACRFIRNIIIARLVSPADFGVGATFSLTMMLLELVSSLGFERLLIQAPDGDDPDMQATAQFTVAVRGFCIGGILWVFASPISAFFGSADTAWAFRYLAIAPIVTGLAHMDIWRLQRKLQFFPFESSATISQVATLLVAYPLSRWLGDFRVLLILEIAAPSIQTLWSHLIAKRPYRWTINWIILKRFWVFGWPLLVNGLVFFAVTQGDRAIVAKIFSLEDLGIFSVAFLLTMAPATMIAAVVRRVLLPSLSKLQGDKTAFERMYMRFNEIQALQFGCLLIGFITAGSWLVHALYGPKYAAVGMIVGVLAGIQAFRGMRGLPGTAATALGDTKNMMYTNLSRAISLPAAAAVGMWGGSMSDIAMTGLGGELVAYIVAIARLRQQHGIPLRLSVKPAMMVIVGATAAIAAVQTKWSHLAWHPPLVAAAVILGYTLIALWLFADLRRAMTKQLYRWCHRSADPTSANLVTESASE